jgi:hypothetical protein
MSKPKAPGLPTEAQISATFNAVKAIDPTARIKRVGPDGVEFIYSEADAADDGWSGKPFGGRIG